MKYNGTKSTWIDLPGITDFPLENLPYGIFRDKKGRTAVATRIGDQVIDLSVLSEAGLLEKTGIPREAFAISFLNVMMAYGKPAHQKLRKTLTDLFSAENTQIRDNSILRQKALLNISAVSMQMPLQIGDYTDFYSSIEHATNLGKLFRDPSNPLLPNWRHLPVGYHGRTSSIVVSGTPFHRPKGQTRPSEGEPPVFGATSQLDFELEMAFITGKKTKLGESLSTSVAGDAIFGFVLFNDLSARDIQKWEYVPLGPFLGKNFASVISPWIVTPEALEPFRVDGPLQEPQVLPYLKFKGKHNFDIWLDVFLKPANGKEYLICHTNYRYMYWNIVQQLAHQTVNGCNINPGDIYASGTISGPEKGSYGSLIEITEGGKNPLILDNQITRTWLEDGDTIIFRGYGEKNGLRIGFGEVTTTVLPATAEKTTKIRENGRKSEPVILAD